MPVAKQEIAFTFGGVQQARNKRGLKPGELVEAINVRLVKEDAYRKRLGFDRAVPTGAFTTPGESFISDGKRLLARDGADTVWARNGADWESRGTAKRALPSIAPGKLVPSASKPTAIAVGSNYWIFTMGSGAYRWTIVDSAGSVVRAQTTQTAASITHLTAETDGTYVWVLWVTQTTTNVTSHRFTIASPGTAVTTATYGAVASGSAIGVDAHRLANGDIAVAATSGGGASRIRVSYLDGATGQEKASPAPVETVLGVTAGTTTLHSAPSILTYDGANGSWYVCCWTGRSGTMPGGSAGGGNLALCTITSSNLATSTRGIASISDGINFAIGWVCGYRATNGDIVVYATTDTYAGTPTQPRPYVLTRYTWNGASTTTLVLRRYSYPVSKPQTVGGAWYLLTGFDDGPLLNFQKTYFLIDSDGKVVAEIAYGQSAAAGLRASSALPSTTLEAQTFTTRLFANGNKLDAALLIDMGSGGGSGGVNDFATALVTCDLAASYSAPARARDRIAMWPGGVPTRAGSSDDQRELAPMLSPVDATFTVPGAALAGPTVVQYLYRMVDADGVITRSAPSPVQSVTFRDTSPGQFVNVKPLTHMMPGVTCQIEVYLSVVSSVEPFLHTVVENDPTVDTIAVAVTPSTISTDAETIYTYGGGLENVPLPAARALAVWRNRTFLAVGSELWSSLEREDGIGPRFNEALVTQWDDGEGDILAIAPVDWNYMALFKRNAISVISGSGPTPTAGGGVSGNYETQTLRPKKGLINARSVLTGPQGAYFQSLADYRIYCVSTGLEVLDVSQGMEDYRTETVVGTNHVEKERQLHFHMDSGAILVLDYAHPTPEQPAGRWMRWTSSGLLVSCGATIDTDGTPVHLETLGAIRTPGTGFTDATAAAAAAVLMKLTTGDLAAAGQLRGEYRLDAVHVQGEWLATNTTRVTIASDYGATSTSHTSASITATPQELYIRPAGHGRVQATRVTIEETISAGEGFVFHGMVLTVQPAGRAKFPSNARRVA